MDQVSLRVAGLRIIEVVRRAEDDLTALPLLPAATKSSLLDMEIFLNAGNGNYHAALAKLKLVNELPEIPPEWE